VCPVPCRYATFYNPLQTSTGPLVGIPSDTTSIHAPQDTSTPPTAPRTGTSHSQQPQAAWRPTCRWLALCSSCFPSTSPRAGTSTTRYFLVVLSLTPGGEARNMSSSSLALTQCGLATLPATPTVRSSCLPQVHVERFLAHETRDRRHVGSQIACGRYHQPLCPLVPPLYSFFAPQWQELDNPFSLAFASDRCISVSKSRASLCLDGVCHDRQR
jgi:hypothetical protein